MNVKKPEPILYKIPETSVSVTISHLPVKEKVNGKSEIVGYKPYMEVSQRLVWFNLIYGHELVFKTEIVKEWEIPVVNEKGQSLPPIYLVRFKATLEDLEGKVLRTAFKTKEVQNDKDYEVCETGAIGRVLAHWGVGTQYATEDLDEGDSLADAPAPLSKGGEDDKGTKANSGSAKLTGEGRGPAIPSGKTRDQNNNREGDLSSIKDGIPDKPLDPKLRGLAETTAETGTYTGQTFEQIFKQDATQGFKWTRSRIKGIAEKKEKEQPWFPQYLEFAKQLGFNEGISK